MRAHTQANAHTCAHAQLHLLVGFGGRRAQDLHVAGCAARQPHRFLRVLQRRLQARPNLWSRAAHAAAVGVHACVCACVQECVLYRLACGGLKGGQRDGGGALGRAAVCCVHAFVCVHLCVARVRMCRACACAACVCVCQEALLPSLTSPYHTSCASTLPPALPLRGAQLACAL